MEDVQVLSGFYYAGKIETLLLHMVMALVDDQAGVQVVASTVDGVTGSIVVTVAKEDLGKVIGKQGRTARSLRTIVGAAGHKHGQRYSLDFVGAG